MKRIILSLLCLSLGTSCAMYTSTTVLPSGKHAIVTKNDRLLFGLLRKVYVCRIGKAGLSNCSAKENP